MKKVCVYCGASPGKDPVYIEAAKALVAEFARRGIGLVYGGASVGVMGALADSALELDIEVIGVIPKTLVEREVSHSHLSELIIVDSMHERKAKMMELSDGFIALPGGLGTLEELFEVLTWSQLRFHEKPCGVLDIKNYYSKLFSFLDHGVDQKFIKPDHRQLLLRGENSAQLLDEMASFTAPTTTKWIEP